MIERVRRTKAASLPGAAWIRISPADKRFSLPLCSVNKANVPKNLELKVQKQTSRSCSFFFLQRDTTEKKTDERMSVLKWKNLTSKSLKACRTHVLLLLEFVKERY